MPDNFNKKHTNYFYLKHKNFIHLIMIVNHKKTIYILIHFSFFIINLSIIFVIVYYRETIYMGILYKNSLESLKYIIPGRVNINIFK